MHDYVQKYKEYNSRELEGVTIQQVTSQKKVIEDSKYVISAIQVGGLDALKIDLDIPLKYGISQCVGDTLDPGGIFRFFRTVPVFKLIVEQIQDYRHNAGNDGMNPLFLNYTNPMAMNTWYCNTIVSDSTVGLCHGCKILHLDYVVLLE